MRLSALLDALPPALRPTRRAGADADPVIRGIAYDSRAVAPGDLFFALRGEAHDGHAYLQQALSLGAVAVVVQELPDALELGGCPAAVVPDSRRALAPVATRFFGEPARELTLVGVTGTNGKTSTTYLVESMLRCAGREPGLVGTVEVRYADVRERALNTTPESLDLQRTLRAMCTRGIDSVAMEVSSHGLELGRVDGCRFHVAAMTNLSQDHLDFHGTMDAYRDSKVLLFRRYLAPGGAAVVNLDDGSAPAFLEAAREAGARLVRVTRKADAEAEVRLLSAETDLGGASARIALPGGPVTLRLPLVGDFNLENLLVACGAAAALDLPAEAVVAGAAACPQVPGRVERVGAGLPGPTVLVDYAHTPDAVDKLLRTLRALAPARLVTVFGCGGERDRGKRPRMAEAVARWSDLAVATDDNPRREDSRAILADVEPGLGALPRVEPGELGAADRRAYAVLPDRRSAIHLAVRVAGEDDIVVIAGKGHEDYQIVGTRRLPFSDPEEAMHALEGWSRP